MTDAIEQLASKLSVENAEIEDFLQELSVRFDQPVTAQEVLGLIETYKGKFSFDNISEYIEQKFINNYIQENVNLINKIDLDIQNYSHKIISYKDIKFIYPRIESYITNPISNITLLEIILSFYIYNKNLSIISYINNFGYGLRKSGYLNNFTNLMNRIYNIGLYDKINTLRKVNHKYFIHLYNMLSILSDSEIAININNICNLISYIQNNKLNPPHLLNSRLFSSSYIDISKILSLSTEYKDKQNFLNSLIVVLNKYTTLYNTSDLQYLLMIEIKSPSATQNYDFNKIKGLITLNEIYSEYKSNDFNLNSLINFIEIKKFILENINFFPKNTKNESKFLLLKNSSKPIYNMIHFLDLSLNKKRFIEKIELYIDLLYKINKLSIKSINKLISIELFAIKNKINLDLTYKKLLSMNIENLTENQIIKIITTRTSKDTSNTIKDNNIINEFQQRNLDNINLFKSRINLYNKIKSLSNKDIFELHTFLNKNRYITDEHIKDTIAYLSKRNTVQTYIFEYIQLVPELRKIQSPIKHPDDLIDDILFKTGLRVNAQKLLTIVKNYATKFHLLEYCYIYTYIKEGLPNIEDITLFLNSIKPMTFVEFQQRLSLISNPSTKNVDELVLMFNSITNDLLPRNIINYNHQVLNGETLTNFMTSLWNPNIHHKSHIQTVIKELWDDICSEKRMYEIPSDGRAEIEAPAVLTKCTNILSFKFIQEGLEAPSIYVLALFRSNGDKPLAGTITINRDGSIKGFVDLINNKTYYLLLQYVIVANYHALVIPQHNQPRIQHQKQVNHRPHINHEITTTQQRQIPRVRQSSTTSSLNDWYEAQAKASHAVVGHERFISKTFRAAQIKHLQAAQAGIKLKPGHTWVQGHARGDATFTHGTITLDGDDLLKPTIFKAPEHIQTDLSKYFNIG